MKNKHLTSIQRNQIEVLLQTKTPINLVSQLLDADRSSIYREIKRNKSKCSYSAIVAQQRCTQRKEQYGRIRKLTTEMTKSIVEKTTKKHRSPKQIVGFQNPTIFPWYRTNKYISSLDKIKRMEDCSGRICDID